MTVNQVGLVDMTGEIDAIWCTPPRLRSTFRLPAICRSSGRSRLLSLTFRTQEDSRGRLACPAGQVPSARRRRISLRQTQAALFQGHRLQGRPDMDHRCQSRNPRNARRPLRQSDAVLCRHRDRQGKDPGRYGPVRLPRGSLRPLRRQQLCLHHQRCRRLRLHHAALL